jgi:hypothetical protein
LENQCDLVIPQQICELRVKPVAIANFDTKFVVGWSLLQEWNEPISECTPIWKDAAVKKRKLKDDRAKLGPRISFVSKNSAISASQSTNTLRA